MSPILLEVRLPDDQLEKLAVMIAARTGGRDSSNNKPYSVPEAARALNMSDDTIRRWVEIGKLKKVNAGGKGSRVLIPVSEIERMRNPQTGGDGE